MLQKAIAIIRIAKAMVLYLKCSLAKEYSCNGLAKVDTRVHLLEMTIGHNHSLAEHKSDIVF